MHNSLAFKTVRRCFFSLMKIKFIAILTMGQIGDRKAKKKYQFIDIIGTDRKENSVLHGIISDLK